MTSAVAEYTALNSHLPTEASENKYCQSKLCTDFGNSQRSIRTKWTKSQEKGNLKALWGFGLPLS